MPLRHQSPLRPARRRLPLLPALLGALVALAPQGRPARAETAAEADYRAAFSAARLGLPPPSSALATEFGAHYRGALPHAAFAMARDAAGRSAWAWVSGQPSPAAAEAAALERCRSRAGPLTGAECRVVARDGAVEGAPAVVPLAEGSIGPFRRSPLHLVRGPEAARGAVVWGHGYGGPDRDNRRVPAPGYASILNDAGWDVLRFDRHPGDDSLYTSLPRLLAGLPALRAAGYRRIVLAGQSRGGWQAVMAAAEAPGLVDAVIATAPAAHGEAQRPNNLGAALDDFRRLLAGLPAQGGPRVLIALFEGDDYDPDPEGRAMVVETLARDRTAPLLALWPSAASGIRGHGGANDWRFTRLYGACVLTLVQAPEAAAPRGLRRDACGGG
jgi:pimeloyl-ACP methyl ester carboxylesterase